VLRRFASNLQSTVRQSDIICRWGGEEFILLLKDTTPEQARELGEKIRLQTEHNTISFNDAQLCITASIGLAQLHADESLEQLITRADRALYRAKQSGRNRLCEETA
jgi:diguanylate cyclase (GGDEF)-like protein